MVQCHVEHFSVLCNVEEATILVDDELVRRVNIETICGRADLQLGLFTGRSSLCLLFEGVLHEAGEDLGELNLRTFLLYVSIKFLLNKVLVERIVEEDNGAFLVQLGEVLERQCHVLLLVIIGHVAVPIAGVPR